MDADRCVMCGAIIPEGIIVCPLCDRKIEEMGKSHPPKAAAEKAGTMPGQRSRRNTRRTKQLQDTGRKAQIRWERFCGMFYRGGAEEYREKGAVSKAIKCLSGIYELGTRKLRK
ncbi:MAG: hypothetical protein LUE14_02960 [Clostridiales bacterium]|nr:hypothetical protein [Clostridiales bacterium]